MKSCHLDFELSDAMRLSVLNFESSLPETFLHGLSSYVYAWRHLESRHEGTGEE